MDENKIFDAENSNNEPSVFCHKCGTKHSDKDTFCRNCGEMLKDTIYSDDTVRCPNCGNTNIDFVTYQASSNFDAGDACCGFLLCGPIGLLCGAKDKTEARTVRKCKKCGKEF